MHNEKTTKLGIYKKNTKKYYFRKLRNTLDTNNTCLNKKVRQK